MTATMYAPYHYAFHDPSAIGSGAPPPPPPQQSSYLGHPHYPHPGDMSDPNAIAHHAHHAHPHHHSPPAAPRLPALQISHPPATSKLRSRRDMASDSPTSRSAAPPLVTANMTPEEEAAAREEARKARKREMGRERQRRKRLRDKAKREAEKVRERMESTGHMSEPGGMHHSALQIPFGSRPANRSSLSSLSVGSYDSVPSSTSTSYSTLPPIAMNISPTNSFAMSASSTSYSDASSPSQSFSPTLSATNSLSGFASESSWNEHTAVFGNLSLSGDADATVRVKAPRASGASLSNITGARRGEDYGHFGGHMKRRKSDFDDEQHQVGLGVMDWQTRPGGGSKSRRPVSVPDGIVLESIHGPSRSPSPPPPLTTDMNRPDYRGGPYSATSPEGVYFANSVVQGLNETQWGGMLHTKLGIQQGDLDRMSPDFAGVYERWRVENNMTQYFLDPVTRAQVMSSSSQHQSPISPRTNAFVTPNPPRHEGERPTSSASDASSMNAPGGTMHLGQAHPPASPQAKQGQSSTAASPVNPARQTPGGHSQAMFPPPAEYGQQWSTAPQLSRGYDPEWQRGNFSHTLSSPMTGHPKDNSFTIPPPPAHGPPGHHPQIAVQTGFVNTAEFQTPGSAGPRSVAPFTPATPVPLRGHNMAGPVSGVPLFYNPQFHQPLPTPVQGSPSQPLPPPTKEADMFIQQHQPQQPQQQQ